MQKATNKVVELKPKDDREQWEIEFERCQHWIEKSLKYQDFYTIDDIEAKIRDGIAFLWPGKESAIVTEFVFFPKKKVLHILCIAGKYKEVEEIYMCIEEYAKKLGINKITGSGRKGWLRKVKHLGFKQENLISKEL